MNPVRNSGSKRLCSKISNGMKVISLWSGGKDCCLACYRAKTQGYDIVSLLNFTTPLEESSLSHGLSARVIDRQAKMTEIPSFQKAMPKEGYRDEFKSLIEEWKRTKGIAGIIFGDIYLEGHKEWIDSVCRELQVTPVMPIWARDTTGLMNEFISLGFKSIIVATRVDKLGKEWLGREIDANLMKEFEGMGNIDPCGENGEFHTFVYDGPLFKEKVKFSKGNKILRRGRWFLEVM
ncbi:MAG: diphthine--ammonia ligase [Candidatus Omnitrophica bacterium]|nr:diphthine--ammonia ligase [Candidatus Omnitrophota bacterium]MBU0881369.1 diphthine--ammonia ligase [Candidatus Omnitrophota bacterium]MBU1808326.1 diphthine--ammonia ligase [Candidatus Omnitrophota bacterium]